MTRRDAMRCDAPEAGRSPDEGWQEQLSASAQGGIERGAAAAPQSASSHQLSGVGWADSRMLWAEKQDAVVDFPTAKGAGSVGKKL